MTGSGTLQLAGAASNTYGLTTVTDGILQLNNSYGFAVPGNAVVHGGYCSFKHKNSRNFPTTSTLNPSAAARFQHGRLDATLDGVIFNSGTLTQGGATLTPSDSGTALQHARPGRPFWTRRHINI